MKKSQFFLLSMLFVIASTTSCKKDNDNMPITPPEEIIPSGNGEISCCQNNKLYIKEATITYNQKEVVLRKDSLCINKAEQKKHHLLQKHEDRFYLVEIDFSTNEQGTIRIIKDFTQLIYSDDNYLYNDLRKLPLPCTNYSFTENSNEDRIILNVNDLVDERGFIKKGAQLQTDKWEDIAKKTVGSVVRIEGGGTGWFIDKDLIITNHHVVANNGAIVTNGDFNANTSMEIRLFDGQTTTGRTWFASEHHDVALVKLEESFDVNLLSLSNSQPTKGELMLNIGGPNLAGTYGERLAILGVMNFDYSINLDRDIHISSTAGQSGSPLFNARGEIVGMLKLSSGDVLIREDVNYHEISASQIPIFADEKVIENPIIGPTATTLISSEGILRLVNFWLKGVDRTLPDQKLNLTQTYIWEKAVEEFYAKYDIGFPYTQIPSINNDLKTMLRSIVTIQKRITDPGSTIASETAIIYDDEYLVGLNYYTSQYEIGDVFDVISYDKQVREATLIAVGSENVPNTYYLYKLSTPFDQGTTRPVKDIVKEVGSSEPLLTFGNSLFYPYPGCFQVNPVMYKDGGLRHQNDANDKLPLFNLDGDFIGYTTGSYTEDPTFDKPSKLYIRTRIPIANPSAPLQLVKAADVFDQFPQLN